jgi:alkylation response protein AidB-like acyl-CoA dehydrogenase
VDLDDGPEEAEFRARVRDFLASGPELVEPGAKPEGRVRDFQRTQKVLYEAGLVGLTWPREYGGQGRSALWQIIVDQELARAGLPRLINWIGIGMCGPAIIVHGTNEQAERYLPPLLSADELWCQLFSEPAAGSDLAGVRTKAERTGQDQWCVNGQKVWTTGAQWCQFGLLLARTDPEAPSHRGLTMFVMDMQAPGVSVRPLRDMSGVEHFSEVFLDDVILHDQLRLGAVNDGWAVAITMLMNERYTVAGDGSSYNAGPGDLLAEVRRVEGALPEGERAAVLDEFASCWIEALACRMTGNRLITTIAQGVQPGPEGSVGKLAAAALLTRSADLGLRLRGNDALFEPREKAAGRWQHAASFAPGVALAGGTSEVMKNIIGERVLGLPPEPRVSSARKGA